VRYRTHVASLGRNHPAIVRSASDNQMVLHGYQIHADMETGLVKHYAQMWALRPVMEE
jgi:hypothetical protein